MRRETENIDQSEARSIPALLPIHCVAQLLVDQVAILKSSEVELWGFYGGVPTQAQKARYGYISDPL